MLEKILTNILIIVIVGVLIALIFLLFAAVTSAAPADTITTQAIGGKYPPGVAALVKLKRAVTYPDGQTMPHWRTVRVQRNLNNAYRKNRSCPGINSLIGVVGYHSRRGHHGLAMAAAKRAINRAYQCRDAKFSREMND